MKKRIQNRLAESRFAFPVMIIYGLAVWLGAGTVAEGAYLQLAFFVASTLLMMMLVWALTLVVSIFLKRKPDARF